MEIKVLLENNRIDRPFKKGHGLSLLIKDNEQRWLFDTGPNKKLLTNAEILAEDLTQLNGIIISHGHSDHTGGLPYLDYSQLPLYLAESALQPHYLKIAMGYLPVGPPRKEITKLKRCGQFINQPTEFAKDWWLLPLGASSKVTTNLFRGNKEGKIPDNFNDELLLVKQEADGLVVFTGCSHHGIVKMAQIALSFFSDQPIKTLLGGFHLIGLPYLNNLGVSVETVKTIGQELEQMPIQQILTCHCTGPKAFTILKEQLGDKLQAIKTGQTIYM